MVFALDDLPGRLFGAGLADRPVGGFDEPVEHVPVFPRPFRHPPPRQRIALEGLHPFLLGLLAQMHPELQHHRAIVGECALERGDFVEGRIKLGERLSPSDTMPDRR